MAPRNTVVDFQGESSLISHSHTSPPPLLSLSCLSISYLHIEIMGIREQRDASLMFMIEADVSVTTSVTLKTEVACLLRRIGILGAGRRRDGAMTG